MSADICELCLSDSGRFNAGRRCCIIRGLANAPKMARKARYEATLREEGKESTNALIAEVNAELRRLLDLRAEKLMKLESKP